MWIPLLFVCNFLFRWSGYSLGQFCCDDKDREFGICFIVLIYKGFFVYSLKKDFVLIYMESSLALLFQYCVVSYRAV